MASSDNFRLIFDRVIGNEGGYINDPNDPGGETKWGISKRAYPTRDIKNLTREDAFIIYYEDFWTRFDGDNLTTAISFQLFDFAVNSGIETAIRKLQSAIGVSDDGYFGPVSYAALRKMSNYQVIFKLNAERLEYMTKLKDWPTEGKGWANRIAQNLKYGAMDT